ncbi:MAG: hypothetical protein L0H84_00130 [Pseudonocardia sp.]|nr:hypothetical protein [Pseudonocardia sp.]
MSEPWLHDPVSYAVMNVYNHYIMDAPDGLYAAMVAYRDQINAAVEALNSAERQYDRTEGDLVLKLT